MYTIKLFCQNGASTDMLARKIKEAADQHEVDMEVIAYPFSTINKNIIGSDVVLLAPQIRFRKPEAEKMFPEYKFLVIDMLDYGLMKGENVFNSIMKVLNSK